MQALVCEAPGRLALSRRPDPVCEPGWAVVRPAFIGVCGTDFHIYKGLHPFLAYPRIIGHELSGTIVETRGGRLKARDRVVVNPYISCGECRACAGGNRNCCTKISVLGVHRDGGMAEAFAVPEENLLLAGDLSPRDAAMVEFLAIGAHAVRRGAVSPGLAVAVVGAGPIGLGAGLFARIAGAEVTFFDINAERLAFAAEKLGFRPGIRVEAGTLIGQANERTGGGMFDVVFDATGKAASMEQGFELVGAAGRYVLVSVVKDRISFADPLFHAREMTLLGSRNANSVDFAHVMDCMARELVPTGLLHTHTASLADAAAAIPAWLEQPASVVKAMIEVPA